MKKMNNMKNSLFMSFIPFLVMLEFVGLPEADPCISDSGREEIAEVNLGS
jgi:hypothetical protein